MPVLTKDQFLMGPRPGTPDHFKRTASARVPLSLHHVLPFQVLRDVFNHLVISEFAKEPSNTKLDRTFVKFLLAVRCDPLMIAQLETCIRTARADEEIDEETLGIDAGLLIDLIMERVAWPEWNLVEGPTDRADDPKGKSADRGFDSLSAIRGLPKRYRSLYDILKGINTTLTSFLAKVESGAALGKSDIDRFIGAINLLNKATKATNLTIVPFNREHWVIAELEEAAAGSPVAFVMSPRPSSTTKRLLEDSPKGSPVDFSAKKSSSSPLPAARLKSGRAAPERSASSRFFAAGAGDTRLVTAAAAGSRPAVAAGSS